MRATATMLVTGAIALGAIGLAVAAPGGGDLARAELQAASGAVHVSNSRAGQALFSAGGVRPGESASGTVTIGNDGDASGRFVVAGTGVQETPGIHGGLLSQGAWLSVLDVTDPQGPQTVYEGAPGGLGEVELGMLGPGDERDYRVQVTLPDGGLPESGTGGDNRFQGATLTLGLAWSAETVPAAATATPTPAPVAPAPTPAPVAKAPAPVAPAPTPAPATPAVPLADAIGLPAANRCVKRGRMRLRVKGPKGTKVVTATVTVNGRVKARLKGARARKPVILRGLGTRRVTLKVRVRASNGRTYKASRSYRPCPRR